MKNIWLRLKKKIEQLPISDKFGRDVSWNIVSLIVLGISGIALNVIIGRFYGVVALGIFNQVFAIYMLLSQVAVGSIQFSVLKYISEFADNQETCNYIVSSAIIIVFFLAGAVCIATFLLRYWIGNILKSPGVTVGLVYILPGLGFFALNKILLSALNGYRHMKAYAFLQALRYILLVALLIVGVLIGLPGLKLPVIFSGVEMILLICLAIYVSRLCSLIAPHRSLEWFSKHAVFGVKAFGSGMLTDANRKIDVLMLGYFASDRTVGIYSLAAMMVEGIVQLSIVLRINVNPLLSSLYAKLQLVELKDMIRRGVKMFYPVMGLVGILSIGIYPFFVRWLVQKGDFMASWPVFCILMLGVMASAGYLPFKMLLIQAGYPGVHTILISIAVVSNIILNALLIPLLGMYGAALATGISLVLSVIYLKEFTWRKLQIHI